MQQSGKTLSIHTLKANKYLFGVKRALPMLVPTRARPNAAPLFSRNHRETSITLITNPPDANVIAKENGSDRPL